MFVVSAAFISGCIGSPELILGCKHFGLYSDENIDEIRDKTNISPHTSLTNYSELTEENKGTFKRVLRNETDISKKEVDRVRYHKNTAYVNRSQMRGFISEIMRQERGILYMKTVYINAIE